jgi:hypothetical protein
VACREKGTQPQLSEQISTVSTKRQKNLAKEKCKTCMTYSAPRLDMKPTGQDRTQHGSNVANAIACWFSYVFLTEVVVFKASKNVKLQHAI